ncbi:MAG: hypothetical protein ACTSPY_15415 [Candidatus Helarchaeota archaeon]
MERIKYKILIIIIIISVIILFPYLNCLGDKIKVEYKVSQNYKILKNDVLVIENYTIITNNTVINKSILIQGNGKLEIRADLLINSTYNYQNNITIKGYGVLKLNNGSIRINNKTNIYSMENSTVLILNKSDLFMSTIFLNTSRNITIMNSYVNSSIIGNCSIVKSINSCIKVKDNDNNGIFNIEMENSWFSNVSIIISGINSYLHMKSINTTMDLMDIEIRVSNNTIGGNSTLELDIKNEIYMNNSKINILGGDSGISVNKDGGNANILINGSIINLNNVSMEVIEGKGSNSSYSNGVGQIEIYGKNRIGLNKISFVNENGTILLNGSNGQVNNSAFKFMNFIFNTNLSTVNIENCTFNKDTNKTQSICNITSKNLTINGTVIWSSNIYFNISQQIYLKGNYFRGDFKGFGQNISIINCTINTTMKWETKVSFNIKGNWIEISDTKLNLEGKNCDLNIQSDNFTMDNLKVELLTAQSDIGGNSSIIFNITGLMKLNRSELINLAGNGTSDIKGIGLIKINSESLMIDNCTIFNAGGNKGGFPGGGGGHSIININGEKNVTIINTTFENVGGSNTIILPSNRVGNSTFLMGSMNITMIESTINNHGGNGWFESGGMALIEIIANNIDAYKSNLNNIGGKSELVDNVNGSAQLIFNIKDEFKFIQSNIRNYGGEGGSSSFNIKGDAGFSYLIVSNGNNITKSILLNCTNIYNIGGNGGNSSSLFYKGGTGGFSSLVLNSINIKMTNESKIINQGGDGGMIIVNTSVENIDGGRGGDAIIQFGPNNLSKKEVNLYIYNISVDNLGGNGGESVNIKGGGGIGGDSIIYFYTDNLTIVDNSKFNLKGGNGGNVSINNNFDGGSGGNLLLKIITEMTGTFLDSNLIIRRGFGGSSFIGTKINGNITLNISIVNPFAINSSICEVDSLLDFDKDTLLNIDELFYYLTDVFNNDTDYDSMPDNWEVLYQLNPLNGSDNITDVDNDFLINIYEFRNLTNPRNSDTDFDLLLDGLEVFVFRTNPNLPDTDGDLLLDGFEVYFYRTDPNSYDTDMDGLNDWIDPIKLFPIEFWIVFLFISVVIYVLIDNYRILKKLQEKYYKEIQSIDNFFLFHENELKRLSNNVEIISNNIEELLLYDGSNFTKLSEEKSIKKLNFYMDFIGLNQLYSEYFKLENSFNAKILELYQKYQKLNFVIEYSKRIRSLRELFNSIMRKIDILKLTLKEKFYNYKFDPQKSIPIKYKIDDFNRILNKKVQEWNERIKILDGEFHHLLENKRINELNIKVKQIEDIFSEVDKWVQDAIEWSKQLRLPPNIGYKHKMNMEFEYYKELKTKLMTKILEFRKEIKIAVEFTRNHISWNIQQLKKKYKDFEKFIFEDILRFISTMNLDTKELDNFVKEKFDLYENEIYTGKNDIKEIIDNNKEFPIADLEDDFNILINEIEENLKFLREKVQLFINPAFRLIQIIHFITLDFYEKANKKIITLSKEINLKVESKEISNKLSKFSIKILNQIKKINKFFENLFEKFPFQIETQYLIILTREWNEFKEKILDNLNLLTKKKKIYKCEIMHEILDPDIDDIWECENCKTIVCGKHLEKWYHKKKSPECFKCGKLGSFHPLNYVENNE